MLLQQVDASLPVPSRSNDYDDLRDWIIAFAPNLGGPERKKVSDAFRLSGYELFPITRIVEHITALTAAVEPGHMDGPPSPSV